MLIGGIIEINKVYIWYLFKECEAATQDVTRENDYNRPTMSALYTIGYATKPIATFISQLKQHDIDAVADVRSVPYSAAFYDYHQEAIQASLAQAGIRYVYLGEELGPRSKDPAHYDACNQVQFDRLMQAPLFLTGIDRLQQGLEKGYNIAMMCAEKDPANCHRSLLIAYFLVRNTELEVFHIDHQGALEQQQMLEQRLVELNHLKPDLLTDANALLPMAYQKQLKATSYIKPDD